MMTPATCAAMHCMSKRARRRVRVCARRARARARLGPTHPRCTWAACANESIADSTVCANPNQTKPRNQWAKSMGEALRVGRGGPTDLQVLLVGVPLQRKDHEHLHAHPIGMPRRHAPSARSVGMPRRHALDAAPQCRPPARRGEAGQRAKAAQPGPHAGSHAWKGGTTGNGGREPQAAGPCSGGGSSSS